MSIYFQWKLGLAMTTFVPVVLVSFYYQTKIIMGQDTVEKKAFEKSAKANRPARKLFWPSEASKTIQFLSTCDNTIWFEPLKFFLFQLP